MTNVYFFNDIEKLPKALDTLNINDFSNHMVPIKLHMGELGNTYFIPPSFVKLVIDKLKKVGAEPYLYDTTVAYNAPRSTIYGYHMVAHKHGFFKEKTGCDVVIGDKGTEVNEGGYSFEVAREIYESSHIVVISHAKGHVLTGFGGAIKNLGMGGVTRRMKRIIHDWGMPRYCSEECDLCGICAEVCPPHAIIVDSDWRFDNLACVGCGKCVSICPRDALRYRVMDLQKGLSLAAKACIWGKKAIYINAIVNITRSCDCETNPGPIICPDIGYLVSVDPAAIDRASLDLIEGVKPGIFEETHKVDPYKQVEYAQKLGFDSYYEMLTM